MSTTNYDSQTTCNCRGGTDYNKKTFTIRIKSEYCSGNVEKSEALLVKTGPMTNLSQVRIRDQDGKTFTDIKDYAHAYMRKSRTRFSNVWHVVEVLMGEEWESGSRFYIRTQPSTDCPTEPPSPEDLSLPTLVAKLYTKLRYKVRISDKSSSEPWYEKACKDGEISVANHNELYRTEVRSGGKYYTTLWGWLRNNPYLPAHEGIYLGHTTPLGGDPWNHIEVLVGTEWVDGGDFCVLRQQICSQRFN